jgi:NCAIR mutase (PurE)-related protein
LDYRTILDAVRRGEISVDDGVERLRRWEADDLEYARIDHHRALRKGFPEVVYCEGKTPEQAANILLRLASTCRGTVLGTRASREVYDRVHKEEPAFQYYELSRMIVLERNSATTKGHVLVVAAGTSDLPVAEEAEVTLRAMGVRTERLIDVGVAGIHRLLRELDTLYRARVIVVVAGMEGALPSVIAGLVDKPVIAVPTSVGYGTHLGGLTPLLAMLNSCATGIGVVNIDNGFGAGYLAAMINALGE